MPDRRPTRAARAPDLRPGWKILPKQSSGVPRIQLSRPGFSCLTEEIAEVRTWARRFPQWFSEALEAFQAEVDNAS